MRHARVLAVSAVAVSLLAAVAVAQTSITPLPDNGPIKTASLEVDFSKTTWGDAKAGQTKAAACAACHSADGNSTVEMYPSIAGQSERYTAQQMALIANGQRTSGASAAMVPFVQDLTPQDMRDIGAYFATQKASAGLADDGLVGEGPYAGKKFYEIGQQLYRGGDAERGIPACMACHGPTVPATRARPTRISAGSMRPTWRAGCRSTRPAPPRKPTRHTSRSWPPLQSS